MNKRGIQFNSATIAIIISFVILLFVLLALYSYKEVMTIGGIY